MGAVSVSDLNCDGSGADVSDGAMPNLFRRMESQEYKGVDGYFKTILGLSDSDLAQIKDNLQVDRSSRTPDTTAPVNKL
jgi:hypothetical protein